MMTLALKSNGTLLHRQLFVILRQDILQGRYRVGDRLPTQEALCADFSVSRITVRRALADLQTAGLIRNEQGVGAFVTHHAPQRPAPANLDLIDSALDLAEATWDDTLDLTMTPSTVHVAERLGLAPGTEVLYVARLRHSGGEPVLYTEAWLLQHYHSVVTPDALRGATLSDDLYDRIQALAIASTGERIPLITMYGATETQGITMVHWELERVGMVGLPLPGQTLKLAGCGK